MTHKIWYVFFLNVKPQSDLPGSGPGPPRTKNPAWSEVVRINPWQIRGSSLAGSWWSGVILGWSLVVRDGPGSAPDVLKCLKHPGQCGKHCNPGLIRHYPSVNRV